MEIQEQEATFRDFEEPEEIATMATETEKLEETATTVFETTPEETTVFQTSPEETATTVVETTLEETTVFETTPEETATTVFETTPEESATTVFETPEETATTVFETTPEETATTIFETIPEETATTETDSTSINETELSTNEFHSPPDAFNIFLQQKKFEEAAEETQQNYHQLHGRKKAKIVKKADQARSCLDSWSEKSQVEFIANSYYDLLDKILVDYCKQSKEMFVSYVSNTRKAMVTFERDMIKAGRSNTQPTKRSQKRVKNYDLKIVTGVFSIFVLLIATFSFVLRHDW